MTLPEFTYEQIVEGERPPVLSGPYIPAYLVHAEINRLRAVLEEIAVRAGGRETVMRSDIVEMCEIALDTGHAHEPTPQQKSGDAI